jgi:hypothetical protein
VVALELEEAYCTCNYSEEVVTVPELEEADCACNRGEEVEHVHHRRRRGMRQRGHDSWRGSRKIWRRIYMGGEIHIVLKNINIGSRSS